MYGNIYNKFKGLLNGDFNVTLAMKLNCKL